MTTEKRIDRKGFLTLTVAAGTAVTLGACADDGNGGGTNGTGGTATGGTATGGTATGGTTVGASATGGTAAGGAGAVGGSAGSSATGGAGTSGGSSGTGGLSGAGAPGGGTGGDGGSGGGTLTCTTDTNNGTHSHPLTFPPSDAERGYQDAPYVLEDGGTGHTHTLELSAYEFIYLAGGTPITHTSSTTLDHSHDCVITCVRG